MRKNFTIFMVLILTFFTMPFGGLTVLADGGNYEDIKDGDYQISVEALETNSDETSAADGFLIDKATLSVDGDDTRITFYYTKDFPMDYGINWTKLEGNDPIEEDENDQEFTYTFKIDEIKETYAAAMNYYVPGMPGDMGDKEKGHSVDYRIVLDADELGDLPEKEPVEAPEERKVGELLTEEEADAAYQLNYDTDSPTTKRQLENPVKLLEKDNKSYIQIPINEGGAQFFRSLKFNGEEVTWNSITEGPYTIQYELENGIEDEIDVSMVIETPIGVMAHDGIGLWFDKDSLEPVKEPESETIEIEHGEETPVKANDSVIVQDSQNTQLTMPEDLPDNVTVTVTPQENVENKGDLEIAGDVFEFDFKNLEDYEGQFELVMGYDDRKFDSENYDVDIYYYNEEKGKWEAQNGTVKNGKVTVDVNHFSTYGVFAEKSSEDTEKPTQPIKVPSDAEEVDYVILHENGKEESTADQFFVKPGTLFEKDGQKYVQVTVTNSDMIKELSSEHGDAVIVNKNDDGSMVVQLKVNNDLSDTVLSMRIIVPDMYDTEHEAIFSFKLEEEPKKDPKKDPKPKPEPVEKSEIIPDKAYEIDYVVKHEKNDKKSAADNFFQKPAHLLYKDGEKYIQLTINSWNFVDWLRVSGEDVTVIKVNEDGSALIQFKIAGDLSDEILLNMSITVPGVYENKEHNARLILDVDSKTEVDESDFRIILENPERPEFGNGKEDETNGDDTEKPEEDKNPQTGDTTNLLLYAILLIGSFIPLAVKLKRRFV